MLVSRLIDLERDIRLSADAAEEVQIFTLRHPNAQTLSVIPRATAVLSPPALSIWTWGRCVEMLWEVMMSTPNPIALAAASCWNALTMRILIWNGLTGGESKTGEWARRETVREMHQRSASVGVENKMEAMDLS